MTDAVVRNSRRQNVEVLPEFSSPKQALHTRSHSKDFHIWLEAAHLLTYTYYQSKNRNKRNTKGIICKRTNVVFAISKFRFNTISGVRGASALPDYITGTFGGRAGAKLISNSDQTYVNNLKLPP